jgi:hypothetical protein
VLATYRPGLSESKPWDAKISANGEVSRTTYLPGDNAERNTYLLSETDLADLAKTIGAADLFSTRGDVL